MNTWPNWGFLWGRVQGKEGSGAGNPQLEEARTTALCVRMCCGQTLFSYQAWQGTEGHSVTPPSGLKDSVSVLAVASAQANCFLQRIILPQIGAEDLRSLPEILLTPSCWAWVWEASESCVSDQLSVLPDHCWSAPCMLGACSLLP